MKPIGDVVLELDPGHRPTVDVFCIEDNELCTVDLWHVQLHNDEAVIFVSLLPTAPALPRDKDGLAHAPMGVPDLPLLVLGIVLQ